jgi:hypothetical protein
MRLLGGPGDDAEQGAGQHIDVVPRRTSLR